jgi:Holliday junction DNA helicase RuvA
MIGYIKGNLQNSQESYLIVNCSGVGYRIEVADTSARAGDEVEYYIYTHVRENELKLYGFKTIEELSLFEMLIDVSGIGPKVALALISELGVQNIVNSILKKEALTLKVKGVGVKTADKIVLELHDKLKKKGYVSQDSSKNLSPMMTKKFKKNLEEAEQALKSLGYNSKDIQRVISNIEYTNKVTEKSSENLVKYLLKKIK